MKELGAVFPAIQTSMLTPNSVCFILTYGSELCMKCAYQRAHVTVVLSPKIGLLSWMKQQSSVKEQ